MKKAKHIVLGFLVAENEGLFSNPNQIELKKLHELAMEIQQSQKQKEILNH